MEKVSGLGVAINGHMLEAGDQYLKNACDVRLGPAVLSGLFVTMWRELDQSITHPQKSVDMSRCGIQDGCDGREHCVAQGECRYTGSPLIPTPPHPRSQQNPPDLADPPDLTLVNLFNRCERLLNCARDVLFADLSTKYETADGELELTVHIGIRSRRGSQHTSSSEQPRSAQ